MEHEEGPWYNCHRCGYLQPAWLIFETGWPEKPRYWCLDHIPLWTRLKMKIRGQW